jgi:hypothetical protein
MLFSGRWGNHVPLTQSINKRLHIVFACTLVEGTALFVDVVCGAFTIEIEIFHGLSIG